MPDLESESQGVENRCRCFRGWACTATWSLSPPPSGQVTPPPLLVLSRCPADPNFLYLSIHRRFCPSFSFSSPMRLTRSPHTLDSSIRCTHSRHSLSPTPLTDSLGRFRCRAPGAAGAELQNGPHLAHGVQHLLHPPPLSTWGRRPPAAVGHGDERESRPPAAIGHRHTPTSQRPGGAQVGAESVSLFHSFLSPLAHFSSHSSALFHGRRRGAFDRQLLATLNPKP